MRITAFECEDAGVDLPVMPPTAPMLAKLARELPPPREGAIFEPKWDGFRAIVYRDGDEVEIESRGEKSFTRYFPELAEPLRAALPARCVVDGEIVVAGPHGLDFNLLQQRIHPAASRIARLAGETPASFIAFDLPQCQRPRPLGGGKWTGTGMTGTQDREA